MTTSAPKGTVVLDLDGTLVRGDTQRHLFLHCLTRGRLGPWGILVLLLGGLGHLLGLVGNRAIKARLARALAGGDPAALEETAARWLRERPALAVRPALHARLAEHRRRGDALLLLSASLEPVVRVYARHLGIERVLATGLQVRDGQFTGRLAGVCPQGAEKARLLLDLARREGLNLERCWAYADRWSDRPLLALVGHPVAVGPGRRLARLARRLGWEILP